LFFLGRRALQIRESIAGRATVGIANDEERLPAHLAGAGGLSVSVVVSRSGSFDYSVPSPGGRAFLAPDGMRPIEKAALWGRRSEKHRSITERGGGCQSARRHHVP